MKKIILLSMMLVATISMSAQSIVGKWNTKDNDSKMDITFNFKANGNMEMEISIQEFDKEVGTINIAMIFGGTYTKTNTTLSLRLDKDNVKINIPYIDWSDEIKAMIKENPEAESYIMSEVTKAMEESKSEMTSDFDDVEEMTIVSLSQNTLELKSGDDIQTFKRVN